MTSLPTASSASELSAQDIPARARPTTVLLRLLATLIGAAVIGQALIVAKARPQDLITGASGMADILRRASPPDLNNLPRALNGVLETFDIALLGTLAAVVLSVPLAVLAAENVTPSRPVYLAARGVIAVTRAVPDLIWALLFVTAVGLGPFPGVLALHSTRHSLVLGKHDDLELTLDPLGKNHGWYDVVVLVEGQPSYVRQFAGHLEDGRPSRTGPN